MNSYTIGSIALMLAGISVGALLLLSLAPIAFGGLDVTMDEDLTIKYDPAKGILSVDAEITIESSMPWDINIDYEVILGSPDSPAIHIAGSVTIPSGGKGVLKIEEKFDVHELLLYLLGCIESSFELNDEDGTFSGRFSLPLLVNITGDYMNSIMGFDVGVWFDLGGEATGKLERDAAGSTLEGTVTFVTSVSLPITTGDITFSITPEGGSPGIINGIVSYTSVGSPNIELSMGTDPSGTPMADILESFRANGGTLRVNGAPFALTPGETELLIDSIYSMLAHAGVV